MPDGKRARHWVRGEVRSQPLFLVAPGLTRQVFAVVARVEHHYVPAGLVEAVVPFGWVAGRRPKVLEVPGSVGCQIVMIAGCRMGAALLFPPGCLIAIGVIASRPVFVGVVACCEYRTLSAFGKGLIQQLS